MGRVAMAANNRGLISMFGQYTNRTSSSFSGIFGTATYPNLPLSNRNIDYYGGNPSNYVYWINIATSNSSAGSVSITSPWSETSSGTSLIGHNRQAFSGAFSYIYIQCNVTYGYTFKGWYTAPVSGGLITSSNNVAIGPTDGYISSTWYAQFY